MQGHFCVPSQFIIRFSKSGSVKSTFFLKQVDIPTEMMLLLVNYKFNDRFFYDGQVNQISIRFFLFTKCCSELENSRF